MKQDNLHFRSKAAHAGETTPMPVSPKPAVPPIYQTSVFVYENLEQIDAIFEGQEEGFIYSRFANPGHRGFETALAGLEGAGDAVCASSGMGVIAASLLSLLSAGDHVVADRELYGGTFGFLRNELPRLGIRTTFVDATHPSQVKEAITPATRVIYLETITNPTLQVADIAAIADIARIHGIRVIVDNTFASPCLVRPLTLGADLVLHSATKYLSGHSALTAGVVAGPAELIASVRRMAVSLGATLSPFDSWLAVLGLKTLAIRMERCSENAMKLAEFLKGFEGIRRIFYPGLPEHRGHQLAARMMPHGFGGMLSFEVADGQVAAAVMENLQLCRIVPSLAGVTTTTSYPVKTSHRSVPPEHRAELGITDGLIRVSVGIEDIQDICDDFRSAFSSAGLPARVGTGGARS